MADKAHITSIDALEQFRNTLIVYVGKARPTIEEVSSEVLRMKLWLQNDQRMLLEGQVRRLQRQLEQAQQNLFGARVSNLRQETSAEQMAVQKAKRALDEAENKLRRVKHWNREFDSRVDPLVKQLEKLHSVLAVDMLQATLFLAQAVNSLQQYADIFPTSGGIANQSTTPDNSGAAGQGETNPTGGGTP